MGRGVNIPWIGGQYTMVRESIYHGKGFDIPWVGDLIYHGYGCQSAIRREVDMPSVGWSKYHG